MKEIMIINRRRSITFQSSGFFELEQKYRRLEEEGWEVEHFPQFHAGKWQVTLFRSENLSLGAEQYPSSVAV
jgi:hypothetical protein